MEGNEAQDFFDNLIGNDGKFNRSSTDVFMVANIDAVVMSVTLPDDLFDGDDTTLVVAYQEANSPLQYNAVLDSESGEPIQVGEGGSVVNNLPTTEVSQLVFLVPKRDSSVEEALEDVSIEACGELLKYKLVETVQVNL